MEAAGALVCASSVMAKSGKSNLADVIGFSHVVGQYHLTSKDFLNEGADQILAMGSRVIKVWFYAKRGEHPEDMYSFNSNWPKVDSLVEGAKLPYFKTLFDKPFTTYIMAVTSLGRKDDYWRDGITAEQEADEQRQFYELAKYLLEAYRGTGKTFVLQHWEGDWMLRGHFDATKDPDPQAIVNMAKWLNARQAGVCKAREEVGCDGVKVYHAAEVNRVVASMKEGRPNMVNSVLPHTKQLDLVSYSAWDATAEAQDEPTVLRKALDYIKSNIPGRSDFGPKNVYLGEFGLPENNYTPELVEKVVSNAVESARDWGCPYIVYWQLYCNELVDRKTPVPVTENKDVRGFWLIRPDGTKTRTWDYFHTLLHP